MVVCRYRYAQIHGGNIGLSVFGPGKGGRHNGERDANRPEYGVRGGRCHRGCTHVARGTQAGVDGHESRVTNGWQLARRRRVRVIHDIRLGRRRTRHVVGIHPRSTARRATCTHVSTVTRHSWGRGRRRGPHIICGRKRLVRSRCRSLSIVASIRRRGGSRNGL
jgi:hypothetical protein